MESLVLTAHALCPGNVECGGSVLLSLDKRGAYGARERTVVARYLFQCGEGFVRAAQQMHVKLTKLRLAVCLPPPDTSVAECTAGLPGLLLGLADRGVARLHVVSSEKGLAAFQAARTSFARRRNPQITTTTGNASSKAADVWFEDEYLRFERGGSGRVDGKDDTKVMAAAKEEDEKGEKDRATGDDTRDVVRVIDRATGTCMVKVGFHTGELQVQLVVRQQTLWALPSRPQLRREWLEQKHENAHMLSGPEFPFVFWSSLRQLLLLHVCMPSMFPVSDATFQLCGIDRTALMQFTANMLVHRLGLQTPQMPPHPHSRLRTAQIQAVESGQEERAQQQALAYGTLRSYDVATAPLDGHARALMLGMSLTGETPRVNWQLEADIESHSDADDTDDDESEDPDDDGDSDDDDGEAEEEQDTEDEDDDTSNGDETEDNARGQQPQARVAGTDRFLRGFTRQLLLLLVGMPREAVEFFCRARNLTGQELLQSQSQRPAKRARHDGHDAQRTGTTSQQVAPRPVPPPPLPPPPHLPHLPRPPLPFARPPPPLLPPPAHIASTLETAVIVLGTGSAAPSQLRGNTGILIMVFEKPADPGASFADSRTLSPDLIKGCFLLDAGEGSLSQLARCFGEQLNLVLRQLKLVWISHRHADHHCGLVHVLEARAHAVANAGRETGATDSGTPLLVVGPEDVLSYVRALNGDAHATLCSLTTAAGGGCVVDNIASGATPTQRLWLGACCGLIQRYETVSVSHCPGAVAVVLTLCDGRKIAYSGDCRPSHAFAQAAYQCWLMIHEATFDDERSDDAVRKRHCTMSEAIHIARRACADAVLLTHFSQRYPRAPPPVPQTAAGATRVVLCFDSFLYCPDSRTRARQSPQTFEDATRCLAQAMAVEMTS